jgi:hypothetical protein
MEIIGSALNRGADTGTSGTTQQRGLKLTTNKALVGIKCQISANATGYTVAYLLDASKSQIATQVITGLSEFTFVYNFLNATTYYIVVDDGAGAYTSGYKVVSYPFAGTEFNIISGYDNGNDISNLAYNINNLQGIETLGTLGTIEKTYSAQGLGYRNIKVDVANLDSANNLYYKLDDSIVGSILAYTEITANEEGFVIDLSTINLTTYPNDLVLTYKLERDSGGDTSPTISNHSVAHEGEIGRGAWEKLDEGVTTSAGSYLDLEPDEGYERYMFEIKFTMTTSTLPIITATGFTDSGGYTQLGSSTYDAGNSSGGVPIASDYTHGVSSIHVVAEKFDDYFMWHGTFNSANVSRGAVFTGKSSGLSELGVVRFFLNFAIGAEYKMYSMK